METMAIGLKRRAATGPDYGVLLNETNDAFQVDEAILILFHFEIKVNKDVNVPRTKCKQVKQEKQATTK